MLSASELAEELAGSRKDVDSIATHVDLIQFDEVAEWMSPYPVQAVFDIAFREPPAWYTADLTADEKDKLAAAPRRVRVAACIPHGYVLVGASEAAQPTAGSPAEAGSNSSVPSPFRIASPLQIKSSLSSLLLSCSPVYTAHFEAQMAERMNILAAEQAQADA